MAVQAEVRYEDCMHGSLLLAVPRGAEADAEAVRILLTACAQHLAVRLEIEALERERASLADEAAGNARMAEVGGGVRISVANEFNNFLNALLLHTAVLKTAGFAGVDAPGIGASCGGRPWPPPP